MRTGATALSGSGPVKLIFSAYVGAGAEQDYGWAVVRLRLLKVVMVDATF